MAWRHHRVAADLEAALAEQDRLEPGWRLPDLEAARAPVADADNGALCVARAFALLPPGWPPPEAADLPPTDLPAAEMLDQDEVDALDTALAAAGPEALAEARRLAELPNGRPPLRYAPNPFDTLLPHLQNLPRVILLLRLDALRRSHEGDAPGALLAIRAAFNAARSIGDEPFAVSQLVRQRGVLQACQAVERLLGQSEPDPDALGRLQKLLREEEGHPALRVVVRGERALTHATLEALEAGHVTLSQVNGARNPSWDERAFGFLSRDAVRADHPRLFPLMRLGLRVAELPEHQRDQALDAFDDAVRALPEGLVRLMCLNLAKIEGACRHTSARLRCLNIALAAERYRRARGAWPDTLAQLVPHFLEAIPTDPFSGQLLKYRHPDDGVVIYSVGPDRVDDGGEVEGPDPPQPGQDVGCRLWNPKQRRQPPPPAEDPPPPE
jgi:hypothetical protein